MCVQVMVNVTVNRVSALQASRGNLGVLFSTEKYAYDILIVRDSLTDIDYANSK